MSQNQSRNHNPIQGNNSQKIKDKTQSKIKEKCSWYFSFSELFQCKDSQTILENKNNTKLFVKQLKIISDCFNEQDLFKNNGLNYEKLNGANEYSLRLNQSYRLHTYNITSFNNSQDLVLKLKKISNHYNDN